MPARPLGTKPCDSCLPPGIVSTEEAEEILLRMFRLALHGPARRLWARHVPTRGDALLPVEASGAVRQGSTSAGLRCESRRERAHECSPLSAATKLKQATYMAPIRILVVDDSVVIRRLLCETLATDPRWKSSASAGDGRIALAKIRQLHPDLVTLDIEMPVMNGLESSAEIRKLDAKLPVIMFSTLTERGASATLDALSLGASDYATKPSNTGSPAAAIEAIRAELIPKIKALCTRFWRRSSRLAATASPGARRECPSTDALRLWPSARRPAARMLWRKFCRGYRRISPSPLWWCSICRLFSPACWRNGWRASRDSVAEGSAGVKLVPDMPGSRRETFT